MAQGLTPLKKYEEFSQEIGQIEASQDISNGEVEDVQHQMQDALNAIFVEEEYGKSTWRPSQCIVDVFQNHRDAEITKHFHLMCEEMGVSRDEVVALDPKVRAQLFDRMNKLKNHKLHSSEEVLLAMQIRHTFQKKRINAYLIKEIEQQRPKLSLIVKVNGKKRLIPFEEAEGYFKGKKRPKICGFVCRDNGFGFDYNMLNLFGSSLKKGQKHLSGGLGEGLDMVMLTAKREGANMRLISSYEGKSWIVTPKHGDSKDLLYDVKKLDTPDRPSGSITIFEIPDEASQFLEEIRNELDPRVKKERGDLLLDFSDTEYEPKIDCDVCFDPLQSGNLYVQNNWILKNEKVLFSYNFHDKFAFEGRDRRQINEKLLFSVQKDVVCNLEDIEQMRKVLVSFPTNEYEALQSIVLGVFSSSRLKHPKKWLQAFIEVFVPEDKRNRIILYSYRNVDASEYGSLNLSSKYHITQILRPTYDLINKITKNVADFSDFPYEFMTLDKYIEQAKYKEAGEETSDTNDELQEQCNDIYESFIGFLNQTDYSTGINKRRRNVMIKRIKNTKFKVKRINKYVKEPKVDSLLFKKGDRVNGGEISIVVGSNINFADLKAYIFPELAKISVGVHSHDIYTQDIIDRFCVYECREEVREMLKPHMKELREISRIKNYEDFGYAKELDFLKIFDNLDKVKEILKEELEYTIKRIDPNNYDDPLHGDEEYHLVSKSGVDNIITRSSFRIIKELGLAFDLDFYLISLLENTILAHRIQEDKIALFLPGDRSETFLEILETKELNLGDSEEITIDNIQESLILDVTNRNENFYYEGVLISDEGEEIPLKIYCINGDPVIDVNNKIFSINSDNYFETNKNIYSIKLIRTLDGQLVLNFSYDDIKGLKLKKVTFNKESNDYEDIKEEYELPTSVEVSYTEEYYTPNLILKDILQNHLDGLDEGAEIEITGYVLDSKTTLIRKVDLNKEVLDEEKDIIIAYDIENEGKPFSPNYLKRLGASTKNDLYKGRFGEGLKILAAASLRNDIFVEFSSAGWRAVPISRDEKVYNPELEKEEKKSRVVFKIIPDKKRKKSGTKISFIPGYEFTEGEIPIHLAEKFVEFFGSDEESSKYKLFRHFNDTLQATKLGEKVVPPYQKLFCDSVEAKEEKYGVKVFSRLSGYNMLHELGQSLDVELTKLLLMSYDFGFPVVDNRERTSVNNDRIFTALRNLYSTTTNEELLMKMLERNVSREESRDFVEKLLFSARDGSDPEVQAFSRMMPSLDTIATLVKVFHSDELFGKDAVLSCESLITEEFQKKTINQREVLLEILQGRIPSKPKEAKAIRIGDLPEDQYEIYKNVCNEAHFKDRLVKLNDMFTRLLFPYVNKPKVALMSNFDKVELNENQQGLVNKIVEEISEAIRYCSRESDLENNEELLEHGYPAFILKLKDESFAKRFIKLKGLVDRFIKSAEEDDEADQIFRWSPLSEEYDTAFSIDTFLHMAEDNKSELFEPNIFDKLLECITDEKMFSLLISIYSLTYKDRQKLFELIYDKMKTKDTDRFITFMKRLISHATLPYLLVKANESLIEGLLSFISFLVNSDNQEIIGIIENFQATEERTYEIDDEADIDKLIEEYTVFMKSIFEKNKLFSEDNSEEECAVNVINRNWKTLGSASRNVGISMINMMNLNQRIFNSPERLVETIVHEEAHLRTLDGDYTESFQVFRMKVFERLKQTLQETKAPL